MIGTLGSLGESGVPRAGCSRASVRRLRRGFTLLEVLVATSIMAIAVTALLSALSTSLRNAALMTSSDRAVILGRRVMDDLLIRPDAVPGVELRDVWIPARDGVEGGWRATCEMFEASPTGRPPAGLMRIAMEAWWTNGLRRRTLRLEAFRRAPVLMRGAPR